MYYYSRIFLRTLYCSQISLFSWHRAHILFLDLIENIFFDILLSLLHQYCSSGKHLYDFSIWSLIVHFYEIIIFIMLPGVFIAC